MNGPTTHIAHLLAIQLRNGGIALVDLFSEIPTNGDMATGFGVLGEMLNLNGLSAIPFL
jgi:hypothetical protein